MSTQTLSASHNDCHVCQSGDLLFVETFSGIGRVTSDSRPFKAGGELAVCATCGTIQKPLTDAWKSETKAIYDTYHLYHQDGGLDQQVFDQSSGKSSPRASQVINYVHARLGLAPTGKLLDYGCGEGAMLMAFSDFSAETLGGAWSLYGFDPYLKNEDAIRSIPQIKDVYTQTIEGTFDLITLIHSLEHIQNPVSFLRSIIPLLSADGHLVIQVPYVLDNPFDLLVADHCTHFTLQSLTFVLSEAGYGIHSIVSDAIPRELVVIASPKHHESARSSGPVIRPQETLEHVAEDLTWITLVREKARDLSQTGTFGIFGTAIAATWLFGELGDKVVFFVDEDPNRVGTTYMGCPVYAPETAPEGADVIVALSSSLAEKIVGRLARVNATFHLPPKPIGENPERLILAPHSL